MELPFATLDVFTTTRLAGNPLAVVTVPRGLRDVLTQADKLRVAREFNLSETVFLHEAGAGDDGEGGSDGSSRSIGGERHVDIFTTGREIPFAGHPTIGTAVWCLHHEAGAVVTGRRGRGVLETLVTKAGPIPITSSAPSSSSYSSSRPPLATGSGTAAAAGHFVSAQIPHSVRIHAKTLDDVLRAETTAAATRKPIPVAGGTGWILAPSTSSSSSEGSEAISRGLSSDPATRAAELAAPVVSIVNGMTFLLVKLDSLEALGAVAVGTGLDLDRFGGGGSGGGMAGGSVQLLDEGWRDSLVSRYYYVDVPPLSLSGKEEERVDGDRGTRARHLRTRMLEANVEDPATGSAASALACYLSLAEEKEHEARGSGGSETTEAGGGGGSSISRKFVMTQGVEMGRESVISVETKTTRKQGGGDVEISEVHIGGTAVVVMKGVLTL